MSTRYRVQLPGIALFLIAVMVANGGNVIATHEPTRIFVASDVQSEPVTDGNVVVWTDSRSGTRSTDIYAARLSDRQEFPVATGDAWQRNPDVDGGIVVWLESMSGCHTCDMRIRGKELAAGEEFDVAGPAETPGSPAISGNVVVWNQAGGTIKGRNLSTMAPSFIIAQATSSDSTDVSYLSPEIDRERIAWIEERYTVTGGVVDSDSRALRLLMIRLNDNDPVVVAQSTDLLDFGVAGDHLAYNVGGELMVEHLAGGDSHLIATGVQGAATDGRYVVSSRIVDGQRSDLSGFDVVSDSTFSIAASTGINSAAHVESGAIVWLQRVGGEQTLHAARIADVLPSAPRPDPNSTSPDWTYFSETGHLLSYGFKMFWERSGGLPIFGYPLTEEFSEQNLDTGEVYTVQYVERQRFEYHPENTGTPYEVLLGRLAAQLLMYQGRDWTAFPKADPDAPHYFPETGHAIAEQFWKYWSGHGLEFGDGGVSTRESLALFGYPISETMMETNADGDTVPTQYFERAVFEYHPDKPESYQVLLRRVGAELLATRGW